MVILLLGKIFIKCVKVIKFLCVMIVDKLSWDAHVKYFNSKLKFEINKLITPSSGASKNLFKPLFTWQNWKPVQGIGHLKIEL